MLKINMDGLVPQVLVVPKACDKSSSKL